MAWKDMCYSSQCFQETSLDCSDGSLGYISPMNVRRDKLVVDSPLLFHGHFVLLASLIFKDLQINE